VFDSPTTRGVFDPTTGVYWAVDTFATPLPDPQLGVADLDDEFWDYGLALFALGAVSPWLSMVDEAKYGRTVDSVQRLELATVACCHSPVIEGRFIDQAFARIRELPSLPSIPLPDQSVLDQIVATTAQPQTEPSAVSVTRGTQKCRVQACRTSTTAAQNEGHGRDRGPGPGPGPPCVRMGARSGVSVLVDELVEQCSIRHHALP
jgi:hypothetical protein